MGRQIIHFVFYFNVIKSGSRKINVTEIIQTLIFETLMILWILFPLFTAFHIRHQLTDDKPKFGEMTMLDKAMQLMKEARDLKQWNCSFGDGYCVLKSVYRK